MDKQDSTKERIFTRKEETLKRKELRKHSTAVECVLWNALKNKQVENLRFRRQHSIGPYIMDFYCPSIKLCIELDGGIHDQPAEQSRDDFRTQYINRQGITILRFSNSAVYYSINNIIESIKQFKQNPILMEGWHKDEFVEPDYQSPPDLCPPSLRSPTLKHILALPFPRGGIEIPSSTNERKEREPD